MKKILLLFMACMCLLLSSCGNSEKPSISTPEKVYVTFHSGSDEHIWELSQDEINYWVDWLNNLTISPIDLEESKILIDHVYSDGCTTWYAFDTGTSDALKRIAYLDCGVEQVYLRMDNDWYCVKNPTEPFNKY